MNLTTCPVRSPSGATIALGVAAYAALRAPADAIAALRQNPGVHAGGPVPPSLLRHSDEQTVVALAAVLRAIHEHGLGAASFTEWGVVAAPRFLGRSAFIATLQRFTAEGAWGVSPQVIPHRSLHSLAGTISQVLGARGPNLGAGGGVHGEEAAVLTVASLLALDDLPGVWAVFSGWEQEPVAQGGTETAIPSACAAAALALVRATRSQAGFRLSIMPGAAADHAGAEFPGLLGEFSLESVVAAFAGDAGPCRDARWQLSDGGRIEISAAQGTMERACPTN